MSKLLIFCDPLDAKCELTLDSGLILIGTPDVHVSGRPGQSFEIPPDIPNANGCTLIISKGGYVSVIQRSILSNLTRPLTSTIGNLPCFLLADDFYLIKDHDSASHGIQLIHIEGDRFINNDGSEFIWSMMTGFCDYKLFLDGGDIRSVLKQSQDLGSRGRRIFGMMSFITNFNPRNYGNAYYNRLGEFYSLLAEYEQYGEFCNLCDCQVLMTDEGMQKEHHARVCDELQGIQNAMYSLGNEWPKNGFQPDHFARPSLLICSQGSTTSDAAPPMSGWNYREWHGRRDYPKVWVSADDMMFVGKGIDEGGHQYAEAKPIIHGEPIGFAEVNIPGRRSTDSRLARSLAIDSKAHGNGGVFHCEDGMYSRLLGPIQQICGIEFFKAMR